MGIPIPTAALQLSLPHGTNKKLKCKTKNKVVKKEVITITTMPPTA